MEILPELKAEASICCCNEILNLTPSDKNLGYRVDVKQGTLAGSKRQKKESQKRCEKGSSVRENAALLALKVAEKGHKPRNTGSP